MLNLYSFLFNTLYSRHLRLIFTKSIYTWLSYVWWMEIWFRQVRHAQGFHNVAGEKDVEAYLSYDYLDASLTSRGWEQVVDPTQPSIMLKKIYDIVCFFYCCVISSLFSLFCLIGWSFAEACPRKWTIQENWLSNHISFDKVRVYWISKVILGLSCENVAVMG